MRANYYHVRPYGIIKMRKNSHYNEELILTLLKSSENCGRYSTPIMLLKNYK